jgi:hypothetical protein
MIALAAAAILTSVSASGHAAGPEITETSPGHFQCAVGKGQFHRADLGASAIGNVIGGRIRYVSDAGHYRWPAMAALLFELEGDRSAGVAVGWVPNDPNYVYVGLWRYKKPLEPIARFDRNASIAVEASLDERGRLTVTTGGFSKSANVGRGAVINRVVHCQSGSFEVGLTPDAGHSPVPATTQAVGQTGKQ